MNVALVLFELARNSYLRREVWGEEIDAEGMRKAFLQRRDVTTCDILTINTYVALRDAAVLPQYDLAIHFFEPSIVIPGAINVLYFQQFYDLAKHDLEQLCKTFDRVVTPSRNIAANHAQMSYLPLAVDGELYRPLGDDQTEEFRSEIVFIGNAHTREPGVYKEFLSPLLNHGLAIFGARWDLPEYRDWVERWRGVIPVECAQNAYAGTKVALSIHSRTFLQDLEFVTARTFQTLACGRATVANSCSALTELLSSDESGLRHAVTSNEFVHHVTELLQDSAMREELGAKGRDFVLRNHNWGLRIDQLLAEL
jgi:hypothetical protein